jgi:ankyrin repeat protein
MSTTSAEDLSRLQPNLLLYRATQARNLPVMMEALALGADVNWRHQEEHGGTALMVAVAAGAMATTEFLLLNGAKLDVKDEGGQTALHHATLNGHTG